MAATLRKTIFCLRDATFPGKQRPKPLFLLLALAGEDLGDDHDVTAVGSKQFLDVSYHLSAHTKTQPQTSVWQVQDAGQLAIQTKDVINIMFIKIMELSTTSTYGTVPRS